MIYLQPRPRMNKAKSDSTYDENNIAVLQREHSM